MAGRISSRRRSEQAVQATLHGRRSSATNGGNASPGRAVGALRELGRRLCTELFTTAVEKIFCPSQPKGSVGRRIFEHGPAAPGQLTRSAFAGRAVTENATMRETFHRVAVVGAGAVGSFFGAMLARAGHRVVLIGRPAHVQAIGRAGLRLEMAGKSEAIALDASSEIAAARGADLVLFSVKSTDTEAVARELAPCSIAMRSSSACRTASRTQRRSRVTCGDGRSRGRLRRHGDARAGSRAAPRPRRSRRRCR